MNFKTVTKKMFASVGTVAFLFAAVCAPSVTYSAEPTTVRVLSEVEGRTFTELSDGQSINYASEGGHRDSTGAEGAGRGVISYSTAGNRAVLTLDNVDVTTDSGLMSASIGIGDLDVVLNGTNSITSNKTAILTSSNNIRFVGSGTLTISQNTENSAISTLSGGNIEFATDSDITINQAAAAPAINSSGNLAVTSGNVNVVQSGASEAVAVGGSTTIGGGALNITQNAAENALNTAGALNMDSGRLATSNTGESGNGLNVAGAINLTGGMVESIIGGASTGIPVYGGEAITINGANVRAIGAAGSTPYGISTAAGKNIVIHRCSVVEAVGNTNAINPANLIIDDSVDWVALAGQSADTAARLAEVKGGDIKRAITDGGYDFVRLYNEIVLLPNAVTYDRNTAAREHTEITVVLGLNGNMLTEIGEGNTALQVGRDYVLNYNGADLISVTFQVREYLETLAVGTHILTFRFNNGTTADFALNVVDTSVA